MLGKLVALGMGAAVQHLATNAKSRQFVYQGFLRMLKQLGPIEQSISERFFSAKEVQK